MKWYEDPEYQLMCEGAEELHNRKIQRGDFYLLNGQLYLWSGKREINPEHRVKLPSQEDLQEMVKPDISKGQGSLCHLADFILWFNRSWDMKDLPKNPTINQAWLAFVMHELYQKKWNPDKKTWEETK